MSSISGKVIEGAGVRKIGEPVLRKEDHRFITGQGEYSDDLNKDGQLYGFFVRSQVAHCIIKEIRYIMEILVLYFYMVWFDFLTPGLKVQLDFSI